MIELLAAFALGTLAGIAVGISFGLWRLLGEVLDPWVHYLAPTPKIVFLPIVVLFFGTGMGSKIAMGTVSAFFPVAVATFAAMRFVRPVFLKVAVTLQDRKSTRLNFSHYCASRMPSSACKKKQNHFIQNFDTP